MPRTIVGKTGKRVCCLVDSILDWDSGDLNSVPTAGLLRDHGQVTSLSAPLFLHFTDGLMILTSFVKQFETYC